MSYFSRKICRQIDQFVVVDKIVDKLQVIQTESVKIIFRTGWRLCSNRQMCKMYLGSLILINTIPKTFPTIKRYGNRVNDSLKVIPCIFEVFCFIYTRICKSKHILEAGEGGNFGEIREKMHLKHRVGNSEPCLEPVFQLHFLKTCLVNALELDYFFSFWSFYLRPF